jgi:hypothetical protein
LPDNAKKIEPTPSLIRYLEDTLDLEKYRKSGKKTDQGSSVGSTDEKMRNIGIRIRNNNDRKSRAIDNLFESMANLIYFFEFIDQHPEQVKRFMDDIEDLFGLKANTTAIEKSPFSRLMRSILGKGSGWKGFDDSKDSRFLFRHRILTILIYRVNDKLKFYALNSPKVKQDRRFFEYLRAKVDEVDMLAFTLDTYLNNGKKKPRRII